MIQELNRLFPTGTRISNKELKIRLQQLYNKYGIDAVAKAVDITRFGYKSKAIKIRTDESANVPEIFNGVLSNDVSLKKTVDFENVMETSPIIMIKKSDTFNWDEFEDVADELTLVFTKRFEKIDNDTIIKNLD